MDKTKKESYNVIPFQQEYNHISPKDLEEIFETLSDMDYLSEKGKKFRSAFWKLFIKQSCNCKTGDGCNFCYEEEI